MKDSEKQRLYQKIGTKVIHKNTEKEELQGAVMEKLAFALIPGKKLCFR